MVTVIVTAAPWGSIPFSVMVICSVPLPAVPLKVTVVDWPGVRLVTGTEALPCGELTATFDKVVLASLVTGTVMVTAEPGDTTGGVEVTGTPFNSGVPITSG